jgi:16S rRNA (guanine527-N7)-methyltransferase
MSPAPADPLPADRFAEILARRAPDFSVALDQGIATNLSAYLSELDRWRRTTNLTGQLSPGDLADHALEALLARPLISDGERVVDIGSGAGFPGLPLAISLPGADFVLVEPRGKRAAFLRHVARTLGLRNTSVLEERIENVGGQTFDVAVTRAVGGFSAWIGDAPFLRPGGRFLAWTTDPDAVASEMGALFDLSTRIPVPASASREIAVFAKSP